MRPLIPRRARPARRFAVALIGAVLGAGLVVPWRAGAAAAPIGATSSGSSSSRTSITLSRPAGTQAGHLMVASIVVNDDDPITPRPAGC